MSRCLGGPLIEEVGNGYAQDHSEFKELTGARPVSSSLILLDLLERYSHRLREGALAHADEDAALAYALADVDVDGVECSQGGSEAMLMAALQCHVWLLSSRSPRYREGWAEPSSLWEIGKAIFVETAKRLVKMP